MPDSYKLGEFTVTFEARDLPRQDVKRLLTEMDDAERAALRVITERLPVTITASYHRV